MLVVHGMLCRMIALLSHMHKNNEPYTYFAFSPVTYRLNRIVFVCARTGVLSSWGWWEERQGLYLQPKHRDAARVARSFFGEHASQKQRRQRCS